MNRFIKKLRLLRRIVNDSKAIIGKGANVTKPQMRIVLGLPPNANVGPEWKARKMSGIIFVSNKLDPKQTYSMPEQQVNVSLMRLQATKSYENPYTRVAGFTYGNAPVSLVSEQMINENNGQALLNTLNGISNVVNTLTQITGTLNSINRGTRETIATAKHASNDIRKLSSGLNGVSKDLFYARRSIY